MKAKALKRLLLLCVGVALTCSAGWAVDESITPTKVKPIVGLSAEESAKAAADSDKEFNSAMSVWFGHRYSDGEKMLRAFSKKYPNSKWTAEADLHVGCYLTYMNRHDEARALFDNVIKEHPGHIVATKAKLRLGNVAERAGRFDEAVEHYSGVLKSNPSWDQFRYANYRARKLIMTSGKQQARINCGPVALAACIDALGKQSKASSAREIKVEADGISLARLRSEAEKLGLSAHVAIMSVEELKESSLPLLAHVSPNHYIAVIGINDNRVELEDSIVGKHEMPLEALRKIWSGVVLSFDSSTKEEPVAMAVAKETWGGCCGQADDDECLGDCPDDCQQGFSGSGGSNGGSGGGCGGPGSPCLMAGGPPSAGAPTWKVNVVNLNLLVKDTPIWYNPGNGPQIAFTLTYSNENSNTGIFGRGWRSPYDMKVFFLPSSDPDHPSLQVHRDNGRIETYEWDYDSGSGMYKYLGRSSMRSYGYRDTIEKMTDGTVVLSLKGGGKYYFMPEGGVAEGRIRYIEDLVGNRVTCEYGSQTGNLVSVKDANNRITEIETTGSGLTERVTKVTIPDGRFALFGYTDGYLTSITDMGTLEKPGYTSTLAYNALAWNGETEASLAQNMTTSPLVPANGQSLRVWGTNTFPPSGTIKVINSDDPPQEEIITYTSKTEEYFQGITRGNPAIDAAEWDMVRSVGATTVPYLSTIETPSKKTKFTYQWWTFIGYARPVVALREVYECAAGEEYPSVPTIYYTWQSVSLPYWMRETRYPRSLSDGGLAKTWYIGYGYDSVGSIADELGNTIQRYEYSSSRDRIRVWGGNGGSPTEYGYDGNHNVISRKQPLGGTWTYDYVNGRLDTEKDPSSNKVKVYTYNSAGQITKIETELTPGVRSVLAQSFYYPGGSDPYKVTGHIDYVIDGNGKTTRYYYNENGETRGFLTSVEDPEGHRTRYHYDEKGRRYQVSTPLSGGGTATTTYEFDNLDRVVKITNPDSTTVETQYGCCHKEWVKDENGKMTRYEYDKRNRLWATINAAVDTTLAVGIAAGDTQIPLTSTTDFPTNGGTVLLKSSAGDAEIVTYGGINGNVLTGVTRGRFGTAAKAFTTATAIEGNMTVDVYDEDVKDGNGNYIHRGILDRKIGLYDPNGHLTQFEYYDNGKLKKTTYPDGTWEQYTYDPAGNMIKKEYGHDSVVTKTINYVYDANNRLVGSNGQ